MNSSTQKQDKLFRIAEALENWLLPLMRKLDTDERDSNCSWQGVIRPSRIIAEIKALSDNLENSLTT